MDLLPPFYFRNYTDFILDIQPNIISYKFPWVFYYDTWTHCTLTKLPIFNYLIRLEKICVISKWSWRQMRYTHSIVRKIMSLPSLQWLLGNQITSYPTNRLVIRGDEEWCTWCVSFDVWNTVIINLKLGTIVVCCV